MSEAAPQTAPVTEPVSAGAPAQPATEVAPASGSPATPAAPAADAPKGYVSEERFNGLMSLLNKTQAEVATLKATPASPAAPAAPESPASEDVTSRIAALEADLIESKVEAAKSEALRVWPQIAPFHDLLVADSPQEMMSLAQEFANRLGGNPAPTAPAPATTDPAAPAAPATPVLPSSPPLTPVTSDHIDALKADVQAKKPGAFGKLMDALLRQQQDSPTV